MTRLSLGSSYPAAIFQLLLTFYKTQTLSFADSKSSQDLGPITFQANSYGDLFSLCTLLCASLFFVLLCDHNLFLSQTTSPYFLSSLMWPLPYLNFWSWSCQSSGWFLGYVGWFDSYPAVFVGWGKPRVLLPHCHLPLLFCCLYFWSFLRRFV